MALSRGTLFVATVLTLAAMATEPLNQHAVAQTTPLGLAPAYDVQRVDSPEPESGGQFAAGIVNAGDIDGDGVDDLIAPQVLGAGKVFVVSGATGGIIHALPAPASAISTSGASAQFGRYVGKVHDLGSCPGGRPSEICSLPLVGPLDDVPEIAVGATGVDAGFTDFGRAWVLDGATGAILKQLDMPASDLEHQAAISPRPRPNFGRTVLSPSSPWSTDPAVQIGDMNGGGIADIVVGAFGYYETGPESNVSCDPGPCHRSGRAYVFAGETIAETDPAAPLSQPAMILKNPEAETDDPDAAVDINTELFGHSASPVGDVGSCRANPGPSMTCRAGDSTNAPDGIPDVVISAFRANLSRALFDVGVVYLLDGKTGAVLMRYDHPDPQPASIFGANNYNQPALGNAGDTASPDVYVPAMRQDGDYLAEGRGYVMNGDFKVFPDNIAFSRLDDPTPKPSGNFGWSAAGIGDVTNDGRNDVLVGAGGPLFPGIDQSIVNDIHFFDIPSQAPIRSFAAPDPQPGAGFGTGVQPLGDVNSDGFLDFAASSGYYDLSEGGVNQGRLYIFRSTTLPPVRVARELTLRLRKHVRATGRVSTDGPRGCISDVPIVIKRDGVGVKTTTTDEEGRFSARLPDRVGRYRAVAKRRDLGDAICLKARSQQRLHRH